MAFSAGWLNNLAMSHPAERGGQRQSFVDPAVHDAVVAQLRVIVVKYGTQVCEDARRVEALLKDLAGEHRREIAVLSGAVRERVPSELLASNDTVPAQVLGQRLVRLLRDNLALSEDAAQWAVVAWASALGMDESVAAAFASSPRAAEPQSGPAPASPAAEEHVRIGGDMMDGSDYQAAEKAYRAALALDPALASAHAGLGSALVGLGNCRDAEAAFRESVRLDPTSAFAHRGLGEALGALERYSESEAAFRESVRLDPTSAFAHRGLGEALAGQERSREAEAAFRESIRLDPTDGFVHGWLGQELAMQGRYREAEAALRESIRLDPTDPVNHEGLGQVLRALNRRREAKAADKEAARLRRG
jgi:tetratricopeptide (TPR) repeat protein